ncbi:MAG: tyrosine-protein phosphatase [Natronospirillum sp.]
MHCFWPRTAAWIDSLVVDLGLLRLPVNRPVELVPGIWRSNQPTPWRLKRLAANGFQSVLNLRGVGHSGSFHLERYYCDQLGLRLFSLKLSSRRPPTQAQWAQLLHILDEAPKPLLVHCKSGADRAGLVAALVQLRSGATVPTAQKQLSLRYLHIKQAATGMMDYIIERFDLERKPGQSLDAWLADGYDRERLVREFKTQGKGSWLVEWVLRRE